MIYCLPYTLLKDSWSQILAALGRVENQINSPVVAAVLLSKCPEVILYLRCRRYSLRSSVLRVTSVIRYKRPT